MVDRNHAPDAVANEPMGDGHGGNDGPPLEVDADGRLPDPVDAAEYQPEGLNPFADPAHVESSGKQGGGMTTQNAGALTGSAGLAKAKKTTTGKAAQ